MVPSARRASSGDAPEVLRLARASRASLRGRRGGELLSAYELAGEPLEEALAPEGAGREMWLGLIDDVPVGYAAVRMDLSAVPPRAVVEELFVEEAARAVGVGEELLGAIEASARAAGCRGIDAVVLPGDRATKNFFESFGLTARAIVVHRDL